MKKEKELSGTSSKRKKPASSPTDQQKTGGNPFLLMRARRDENDPDYKTAALVDNKVVPEQQQTEAISSALAEKYERINGNRPVSSFGSPANTPQKRPNSVYTPNGTKLTREKVYGFMIIYSNHKFVEIARQLPDLEGSDWQEYLQATKGDKKRQEIVITEKLLNDAAEARKHGEVRGSKGIPSQNQTLAASGVSPKEASATKMAKRLQISEDNELWEWLHLIAFAIKGRSAQTPDNLSGGTAAANTDMIFSEDEVSYLASTLNEDFILQVESVEMGAHFAKEIHYTIITKKFSLPFVFDAQTSIKPSLKNKSYIHTVVETLVEFSKPKDDAKKKSSAARTLFPVDDSADLSPAMPLLFFAKPTDNPVSKKPKADNEDNPKATARNLRKI